jgi:hypothetical protein
MRLMDGFLLTFLRDERTNRLTLLCDWWDHSYGAHSLVASRDQERGEHFDFLHTISH